MADTLSRLPEEESASKMANKDGKIILYALAKRPSSNLRNRLQNFAQEQKLDPILEQKIKDVEDLTNGIIYDIIDECHEMYTHIGPLKVIKMLNDFFYYPKLVKIVRRRLASCDSCHRNKVTNQTCFSEMKNYLPERPNEILSIDFYGGFKYILSTIDAFSKYIFGESFIPAETS